MILHSPIPLLLFIASWAGIAYVSLKHDHDWQATAVRKDVMAPDESEAGYIALRQGIGLMRTQVLYKCQTCPKVKVETIAGHWTLDDIRGKKGGIPNV